jgi:hypothetical protein
MRLSFRLISFLLAISACTLIVEVDVPYKKDVAVINAIGAVDSLWTVNLTRSKFILDTLHSFYFQVIDDADVSIYKPDGSIEKLAIQNLGTGIYRGTTHPEIGKTYKIVVNAPDLDPVEAEMTMPDIVPIVNVEWDSSRIVGVTGHPGQSDESTVIKLKVTLNDPPNVDNYYDVQVYLYYAYTARYPDGTTRPDTAVFRASQLWITDPAIASKDDHTFRFSDKTFTGQTYTATLDMDPMFGNQDFYRVDVVLTSMTESFFKYQNSKDLHYETMDDPLAQPSPVYSNTTAGMGIFAGNVFSTVTYYR